MYYVQVMLHGMQSPFEKGGIPMSCSPFMGIYKKESHVKRGVEKPENFL